MRFFIRKKSKERLQELENLQSEISKLRRVNSSILCFLQECDEWKENFLRLDPDVKFCMTLQGSARLQHEGYSILTDKEWGRSSFGADLRILVMKKKETPK